MLSWWHWYGEAPIVRLRYRAAQVMGSIALALFCAAGASFAQGATDAKSCAPIAEPLDRLACYDAIFNPAPDLDLPENGLWDVRVEETAINNRQDVHLELASEGVVPVEYGLPQQAKLRIRCLNNVTSTLFSVGGNYMSEYGRFGEITYRIDNGAPRTIRGRVTSDNQSIGLPTGAAAIPFVQQILAADTLLVSVNPVNRDESPVALVFHVEGLDKAIQPLRQSCGW
jgi:type VI secretion system protein VasI